MEMKMKMKTELKMAKTNWFLFCVRSNSGYQGTEAEAMRHNNQLDTALEQALKEAEDDVTFRKVKRMSYSSNAAGEVKHITVLHFH